MSYRNPQYKVISQAQNYKDMLKSIANAAGDVAKARAEVAEENKKTEDAEIGHRIVTNTNYSKEINTSGVKKYDVFNNTLDGLDLEYEKYSMDIFNKECGENDPGCKNAIANQQFLIDLPDKLVGQAATWQEQVDNILENKNVDPNDPMYNKLQAISKILGKTPGYKANMEVVPVMDEETGQYTGTMWKFTGDDFGEDGFEMTSAELERLTEGDENIVADSPEYWDQSNRINQSTPLFKGPPGMNPKDMWNDNGTPANGVILDPKFQLRNPYSATETVGPNGELGTAQTPDSSIRYGKQSYTAKDGTTKYKQYQYNVIAWDENLLKDSARNSVQAEADAMLDVSDPKDAIAFWNNNLKGKYTKDMGDYNGVMPYQNMNAEGDKNLIYDMDKKSPTYGQINPKFKENFYKAYEQYYYDNTLKPFVDQGVENRDVSRKWTDKCFNADGTTTECGPNAEGAQWSYGAPHDSMKNLYGTN